MSAYPIHTIDTAPVHSQPVLRQLQSAFGAVPNIAAVMAASPVLINAFVALFERVHASSLTEAQIQTLLLTNAVTNASAWPAAFHTALALQHGVAPADVAAIRRGALPEDPALAALSQVARTLIDNRGQIADANRQRFYDAGFGPEQLLEVIAVVAASTITNYTAGVAHPPLEPGFAAHAWSASTQ